MKGVGFLPVFILGAVVGLSCNKQANNVKRGAVSAFTIVNAVVESDPMIANLASADSVKVFYSTATRISYGSSYQYTVPSGILPTVIYEETDTVHPVYKNNIELSPAGIHSLFLSGVNSNQSMPDTLLTEDHPPFHSSTDSSIGVRFVNLSPGSPPISINIQGKPFGSEVGSLPYKSITPYKTYGASSISIQYVFEFRDASSDSLLTTLTFPANPFRNITIVINGLVKGAGPQLLSTFLINNF